jgi:glycosyltransferase involved in cell wall biosynthesis
VKIAHVNNSDIIGGAARAAYRIHHALRDSGVDSQMYVSIASSGDHTVQGAATGWRKKINELRRPCSSMLARSLQTTNGSLHSCSIFPSRWPDRLNSLDVDLVHLHWVTGEMMSVADIGKVEKPVVWTLHDMWPFCGAEHYTEDLRWRDGYSRRNRPPYESGFDLNRWTWKRKRKHWQKPMHIVSPSRWLADCAGNSALMRGWPIHVIPNAIDTDLYQPVDKRLARSLLHLPMEAPLLLFGAMGGTRDPRKGFDLLRAALGQLHSAIPDLNLVVLGELAPKTPLNLEYPIHYAGHLSDDISLRLFYSASNAVVVPSRQESFSLCSAEAQACGTPVVTFNVCGPLDIVVHQETGYLAESFNPHDLAHGIAWVLSGDDRRRSLSAQSRKRAIERFSFEVVAKLYRQVYEDAVA